MVKLAQNKVKLFLLFSGDRTKLKRVVGKELGFYANAFRLYTSLRDHRIGHSGCRIWPRRAQKLFWDFANMGNWSYMSKMIHSNIPGRSLMSQTKIILCILSESIQMPSLSPLGLSWVQLIPRPIDLQPNPDQQVQVWVGHKWQQISFLPKDFQNSKWQPT